MRSERPIQVYLDAQHDRALRRIAEERGSSLSEIIRESVELWLLQLPAGSDPAWDIVDLGESDTDDLGRAHDAHLVSALEGEADR